MAKADLLNSHQMAAKLDMTWEAFRKSDWRVYPHTWVGTGRDLRSARFVWYEDCSHLKIEGGGDVGSSIHEGRKEGVPGGIRVSGPESHQGRVSDSGGRKRLDFRRKKASEGRGKESSADADGEIDVFRRIRKVPGGLQGQDAARHI